MSESRETILQKLVDNQEKMIENLNASIKRRDEIIQLKDKIIALKTEQIDNYKKIVDMVCDALGVDLNSFKKEAG